MLWAAILLVSPMGYKPETDFPNRQARQTASLSFQPAHQADASGQHRDAGRPGAKGKVQPPHDGSRSPSITTTTSPFTRARPRRRREHLGDTAADHFLVELRQLAHEGDAPVAEPTSGRSRKERGQAQRRLEQDDRTGLVGKGYQPRAPVPRLSGKESLEDEPVGRKAAHHERGRDRRRPRDDPDVDPRLDARAHERVARIGEPGHTGVGDDRDVASPPEALRSAERCVDPRSPRTATPSSP